MIRPYTKKRSVRLIALVLMFSVVTPLALVPKKAHAIPVFETGLALVKSTISAAANVATEVSSGLTAGSTAISAGKDTKDTIEDYVIRPLALALGRAAIKSITDSTVNWINGGFEGSPAFETDLKRGLRRAADGEAQRFLTNLAQNTKIDSPYVDSLITNIGTAYYLYSSKDALAARLKDTLGRASQNPAAFRAGNFQEGGWDAWFETFSNPANNPIGANMIASQAIAEQISSTINQRVQELAWGKGFLSWRGDCINSNNGNPSAGASSNNTGTGASTAHGGGATGVGSASNTGNGGGSSNNAAQGSHSLSDADSCAVREIVTPGSFIENKLNIASDSSLRQLELAQSIDQILGALAQQLISKALGGSGGLRGVSNPSQGGGASAVTSTRNTTEAAVITNQEALAVSIQTSIMQVSAWKTDSQKIVSAAQSASAACVNNSVALNETVTPALTRAQAAVVRADALIATLTDLGNKLQGGTSYELVASGYQGLLDANSPTPLPSATVLSQASADAKDSGTAPIPSLFTELTTLTNNGCRMADTTEVDLGSRF